MSDLYLAGQIRRSSKYGRIETGKSVSVRQFSAESLGKAAGAVGIHDALSVTANGWRRISLSPTAHTRPTLMMDLGFGPGASNIPGHRPSCPDSIRQERLICISVKS
jgi:hypothetical protein